MWGEGVVGRNAELAEVDSFLAAAKGGFAALVLEGEPGIGKTTVWREARRRAEEQGACVLSCRPSAAEAKLSFSAVADLLSPIEEKAFAELPAPQRDALAVALLRAAPTGPAPSARAVAAGFLTLVRQLAAERPVVLAVDDAQWLDPPSQVALEFTARRLEHETVGLLCSLRSPTFGPTIEAAIATERLQRVALGSLSLAAIGLIVADRLGRVLPRPVLVRIKGASAGNPFYALEVARLLVERGLEHGPGAALPVPDDLRELTAARIGRLPAASREALLLAAVLSTPDGHLVDLELLAPADDQGVVNIDERGRIEFVQPLFAAAVYSSVSSARRREAHRRAAALVSDAEQRARHLALAAYKADGEVARQLDAAAAQAALRGAPDAAAELVELAVQRTPPRDADQLGERLLRAARYQFDAGDLTGASALVQRALEQSRSPTVRARALQLSAQLHGRRSNFADAMRLAREALDLAGTDHRLTTGVRLELAYCSASMGDFRGAAAQAGAAVEEAEAGGDDGALAEALASLTISEFMAGHGLDEHRLERALELEDPRRTETFVLNPRYIKGVLHLWTGRLDEALRTFNELREQAVERGQEGFVPMLYLYLVWTYIWRGELGGAARIAEDARETAALLEDPTATAISLGASALVHAHDGRTEQAREEAFQALALFEQLQWRPGAIWPLWALGFVALSEGHPAEVDNLLGPLSDQLLSVGPVDPVLFIFLPDEVEALIALGQVERAQTYLGPFEALANELDRPWALAVAWRLRGVLAATTGEREVAYNAFDRALLALARVGMPFERARTLLLAGQVYRRYKNRSKAHQALSEALELFEAAGAPLWAANTRAEMARVGRPSGTKDVLTETERRLAELAATGLSNREVADRAFVSLKTVEANLTRVYRKLGLRSRVGLAVVLRADGAAPAG